MFFFLLQTEQGDIFKVTLDTEEDIVRPLVGGVLGWPLTYVYVCVCM